MPKDPDSRCSFCRKRSHEVKMLIAGPDSFICNECVSTCQDILREEGKDTPSLEKIVREAVLDNTTVDGFINTYTQPEERAGLSVANFLEAYKSASEKIVAKRKRLADLEDKLGEKFRVLGALEKEKAGLVKPVEERLNKAAEEAERLKREIAELS